MSYHYGTTHKTERAAYDALDSLFAAGEISGADYPAIKKCGSGWRIYLHDRPEETYWTPESARRRVGGTFGT
jgi:hypothetical protein